MEAIKTVFAIIGLLYFIYILVGLTIDITTFDQTKGGYEAPYQGWTGTPVNWDSFDQTNTGLVKRGYVIDVHINGASGMISFDIFGKKIDWQTPSDLALIVHQPREGIKRRVFNPEF